MDKRMTEQQLLTAAQVADRLSMKESTIRAWLLRRRLSYVHVGKRAVRIPVSEVERIIDEGIVSARDASRS